MADPIIAFLDQTIALLEGRRAARASLVAGIAIGVACLACSPGWAAIMFATAAVDVWQLKHWSSSGGR